MDDYRSSTIAAAFGEDKNATMLTDPGTEETLSQGVLIPAALIYTVESVIGVIGNVSVIVAVKLSKRLQTITNVYVVTLACSDILSALILPIQIGAIFGALDEYHIVCAVVGALWFIFHGFSMITLVVIAFNRYFLVTQPMQRYRRIFTKRNIALINLSIFAYPTILVVLFTAPGWASFGMHYGICDVAEGNSLRIIVVATIFCMMITIVYLYLKIFLHVRNNSMTVRARNKIDATTSNFSSHGPEASTTNNDKLKDHEVGQRSRLELKISQNMLAVVVCFYVCITPIMLIYCIKISLTPALDLYFFVIFSIHCCLNPLIYACKHPVFRQVFGCMMSRDLRSVEQPSKWLRERITTQR